MSDNAAMTQYTVALASEAASLSDPCAFIRDTQQRLSQQGGSEWSATAIVKGNGINPFAPHDLVEVVKAGVPTEAERLLLAMVQGFHPADGSFVASEAEDAARRYLVARGLLPSEGT